MRRVPRPVVQLAALVLLLLVGLPSARPRDVVLVGATSHLSEHVAWAMEAFTEHGLQEPIVSSITFDAAHPLCADAAGYFFAVDHSILVCFDAQTMALGSDEHLHEREVRALLHELAHAWMTSFVSGQQQAAATAMLGSRSWDDPDDPWCHRGCEMAAEAFVWWLTDGRVVPRPLASKDPAHLEATMAVLTGG